VTDLGQAGEHLRHVDGVMMGRAAYQEPWRLLGVDTELFGEAAPYPSVKAAIEAYFPYIERELAHGVRLHAITRHILGAFRAVPGARAFRRPLSVTVKPGAGIAVLREALDLIVDTPAELTHTAAA
jgi:tRNA-dihydrouridine synthase A